MLNVKDIAVRYGGVTALREVSLEIKAKEIVTVIGSNGAGKSTLLKAISGVVPVSEGTISFEESLINNVPSYRRVGMGIGYIPEGREIFGPLSVMDNLLLGAYGTHNGNLWRLLGDIKWFSRRKDIGESLEYVFSLFPRLKERQKQVAGSLSGGEQQMLALGRALMGKPRLLILDEPSLGLAPNIVREIMQLLKRLREGGMAVLLVEQDAVASLKVADNAVVLERGRVTLQGTAKDIMKDDRVRQAYLGKSVA